MRSLRFSLFAVAASTFLTPAHAGTVCPSGGGLTSCSAPGFSSAPSDLVIDGTAYRTYDGSGNNITNTEWGASGASFDSRAQSTDMTRIDGPAARDVSVGMGDGGKDAPTSSQGLSSMFWAWGQFLDHDITLTAESHDEELVLGGDKGSVTRSVRTNGTQTNDATAFIDASMVYGTNENDAKALRTNDGSGRMIIDEDGYLPTDEKGQFKAGDPRVGEQQQLTAMHTIFAREHNRIADSLSEANTDWSGEKVYQEARALVGAQIQAVTYNEWLPKLLGDDAIDSYQGYDSGTSANLTNEFSTCAFRFCHSMIPDELERLAENGDPIAEGHLKLRDGFFNPDEFRDAGGTDPLLRGLAQQEAMEVDMMMSGELRNFLNAGDGEDGDLMARNIARGRDHGIENYNVLRAAYGLEPVDTWEELSDDPLVVAELRDLYGATPDGLDPFLGALLERPKDGSIVGELNWSIITDQFTRLRDGDRFWYENLFGDDVLAWLNNRSLADIIRDNTGIEWLQEDVFIATERGRVPAPNMIAMIVLLGIGAGWRRRRKAA